MNNLPKTLDIKTPEDARKLMKEIEETYTTVDEALKDEVVALEEYDYSGVGTYLDLRAEKVSKDKGARFMDIVRAIESGGINAIMCTTLHNLTRKAEQASELIRLMEEGKLCFIASSDKIYYADCEQDMFQLRLLLLVAKQYQYELSRNIKRGIQNKKKNQKGVQP